MKIKIQQVKVIYDIRNEGTTCVSVDVNGKQIFEQCYAEFHEISISEIFKYLGIEI